MVEKEKNAACPAPAPLSALSEMVWEELKGRPLSRYSEMLPETYSIVRCELCVLYVMRVPTIGDPPLSEIIQLMTAKVEPRLFRVTLTGLEGTVVCFVKMNT